MSDSCNFLDVKLKINNDNHLQFDIYYKPTNAFCYLRYSSCHPKHTRDNIATSLGKRIVRIVSDNRDARISELKERLAAREHPHQITAQALSKVFQPQQKSEGKDVITFTYTHNPNHYFNKKLLKECLKKADTPRLKKTFGNCNIILATRQAPNLRKMLVKAKFTMGLPPKPPRSVGLIPCGNCTYCERGYIKQTEFFTLKKRNRTIKWKYNRQFSCNSANVLYVVKSEQDDNFYVGKTKMVKHRISKHISDINHPENSNCKKCTLHLRRVSNLVEPYFQFYPFFYVDDPGLRAFMEARFIKRLGPPLNGYLVT